MSELQFIPVLFEKLKSISFFDRIFRWKNIVSLVIESYNEFKVLESFSNLSEDINLKNIELSDKDKEIVKINELKNLELSNKDKDIIRLKQIEESLKNNLLKVDKENNNLNNKNELLNQQFIEVEKKLSTTEEKLSRQEKDYSTKTNELNLAIHDYKESKLKLQQEKENETLQELLEMKNTWKKHETLVEQRIRLICGKYNIEYISSENVPFKGKPDNTIKIGEQYIIFDAKSPGDDSLDNFVKYIKSQAEDIKKYIKEDNVKNIIYLVIPSNTVHLFDKFYYNMTNYDVYIISLDSLDVVIRTLNIWLNYETEGLLNADDKDNICRIIGQFLKATKRKIQIENGINQEILNLYDSIKDLPGELKEKIVEFEKSFKLNPVQDRREKIISEEEIKKVAKKIDKEISEEI